MKHPKGHRPPHAHGYAPLCILVIFVLHPLYADEIPGDEHGSEDDAVIVARVGDERITQTELEQAVRLKVGQALAAHEASMPNTKAPRLQITNADRILVLNDLIEARVLYVLAKQAGLLANDEAVAQALERAKSQFEDEEAFQAALVRNDTDIDAFKKRLRMKLTSTAFLREKMADVQATDAEVELEYKRLRAQGEFVKPATVEAAHILVAVQGDDETAWENAEEQIEAARARIVAGEAFADVAKEVSDDRTSAERGGVISNIRRDGRFDPEFAKQAFETPIGEVSPPFRTQYGWHILTPLKRDEARPYTLDEVSGSIRKRLDEPMRRQALQKLIAEGKDEVGVEVFFDPEEEPASESGAERRQ